jgi:hypothetical protein
MMPLAAKGMLMRAFMLLAMMERPHGAALTPPRPWIAALPALPS